ncbi:GIY-YIG nuclease family protein [Leeuwenhoekiella nanhaiensis]|uniref:Excinuclease ABC subunit C n=1 Tax=Leeuwenhoekiella nanhaiensis TaxID=1655491 RepID=A0A2G1VN06_9FLAO|nr:GIY-YIG nuclease family protein [Leeuwenhoekiella nanhaiensis]PHQ28157.1 excinuclease ABC subunit C [Leeuwenhoekiella nanhaiensis]
MNHYLYIIYSEKIDKFYVGETSDVEQRISIHNSHKIKSAYTKAASDWVLKLSFSCADRNEALYLERFIKRMKSKKFIEKLVNNPQLLNEILSKR